MSGGTPFIGSWGTQGFVTVLLSFYFCPCCDCYLAVLRSLLRVSYSNRRSQIAVRQPARSAGAPKE